MEPLAMFVSVMNAPKLCLCGSTSRGFCTRGHVHDPTFRRTLAQSVCTSLPTAALPYRQQHVSIHI